MSRRPPTDSQRRLLTWLQAVVAGEDAVLGELDDALAGELQGARLQALAVRYGADHRSLAGLEKEAFLRGASLVAAACRGVAILAAAGVPALVLKGAPLATAFWPGHDVAWRPSADVDILVAPKDAAVARAALLAAGLTNRTAGFEWYLRRWHFHSVFVMDRPPAVVELHWDLLVPAVGRLPVAEMIAGAVTVTTTGGRTLPAPDSCWQFISACIHAVQHQLDLRCLLDIGFIGRSLDQAQWQRVAVLAQRAHIGPLVWFAAGTSAETLLWRPDPALDRLKPGPVRATLLRRYRQRHPALEKRTTTGSRIWRAFLPLLAGSGWRWLRYLPMTLADRPRLAKLVTRRR